MTNTPDNDPWSARNFKESMNADRIQRIKDQYQADTAEDRAELRDLDNRVREMMSRPPQLTGTDKLVQHLETQPNNAERLQSFKEQMDAQRGR